MCSPSWLFMWGRTRSPPLLSKFSAKFPFFFFFFFLLLLFFMATRSVVVFVAIVSVGLVCVTKIIQFHSFLSLYKNEKED